MTREASDKFVAGIERDAQLVDAIHRAMYALVITTGTMAIDESGDTFRLNFEPQINGLRKALILLGIDPSQPMPAPVRDGPKM